MEWDGGGGGEGEGLSRARGAKRNARKRDRKGVVEERASRGSFTKFGGGESGTTRKFRHKSNDPPASFAGVTLLPRTWKLRKETRERERESTFPAFSRAPKSARYEPARADR